MSPDDPRHGEYRGYRAHRTAGQEACEPCKRAAAGAEQRYALARLQGKPLRYPAAGTQRRLRALQAVGWTLSEISARLGESRSRVEKWCTEEKTFVYARTAEKVAAAYEEFCRLPDPDGPWAKRNRGMAARKGYAPPIAWDDNIDDPEAEPYAAAEDVIDDVVVERLMSGRRARSTRAEKVEAMRRWRATGRSELSLCRMHGWKPGRYVAPDQAVSA